MKIRRVSFVRVQKANQANKAHGFSFLSFPLFRLSRSDNLPRIALIRTRRETSKWCRYTHGYFRAPGDVAQLGEHLLCKQGVSGSSPLISTSTLTTE